MRTLKNMILDLCIGTGIKMRESQLPSDLMEEIRDLRFRAMGYEIIRRFWSKNLTDESIISRWENLPGKDWSIQRMGRKWQWTRPLTVEEWFVSHTDSDSDLDPESDGDETTE